MTAPDAPLAGVAENRRFLAHQRRLARGMVGAHASFTLSDETLAACAEAARAAGTGVHIHVAEDAADQRDSAGRGAGRVVERLQGAGIVTDRALLAHCVHVDPGEMQIVSASGATVVCNPRSNMNNAVGHSPFNARPADGPGARVALGTDGIGGDMVTESQVGFFRAKAADLSTPPSWPLVGLAEGSRLVGRVYDEPLLGTLHPGAPADITVYEYGPPRPFSPATSPAIGCSACRPDRCGTSTSPASSSSPTEPRRAPTRPRWPPTAPG